MVAWIAARCLDTSRQRPSAIVAMIFSKLNRSIRSRCLAHGNQPRVRQAARKPAGALFRGGRSWLALKPPRHLTLEFNEVPVLPRLHPPLGTVLAASFDGKTSIIVGNEPQVPSLEQAPG